MLLELKNDVAVFYWGRKKFFPRYHPPNDTHAHYTFIGAIDNTGKEINPGSIIKRFLIWYK